MVTPFDDKIISYMRQHGAEKSVYSVLMPETRRAQAAISISWSGSKARRAF